MTRLIAEGGMGVVYEGWHTAIDRPFALKFVHRYLADSPEWMERFRSEAGAAGRLMSDHIAAVLDYGTVADGAPYIVMEYLQGQTLGERLEQGGRLPILEATEILLQASRGMALAHRDSVVHRDLKPDNLFLSRTDAGELRVKVLDFGIAKVAGRLASHATQTGQIMGTPAYMSPEQARGDSHLDQRTDVYSLGVVAYEALTGQTLFTGASYNAVLFQVLNQDVPPLVGFRSTVADGLAAVVERAMDRDPARRQADCQELVDDLERCLINGLCVRTDSAEEPGRSIYAGSESTTGSVVLAEPDRGPFGPRPFPKGLRWSLAVASLVGFGLALWSFPTRPTDEARQRARALLGISQARHAPQIDRPPAGLLPAPAADSPAVQLAKPLSEARGGAPEGSRARAEPPAPVLGSGLPLRKTPRTGASIASPSTGRAAVPEFASGLPPPASPDSVSETTQAKLSGMLSVQSEQGGVLIIDGKPMGSLPRLGIMLPSGRHEVVFVHPTLGRNSIWVELRPGQSTTLGATWPPSTQATSDPCSPRWFVNRLGEREIKPECRQLIDPDL